MRKYIYALIALLGMGFLPNGTVFAEEWCPYPKFHVRSSKEICEWNRPDTKDQYKVDIKKLLSNNNESIKSTKVTFHLTPDSSPCPYPITHYFPSKAICER